MIYLKLFMCIVLLPVYIITHVNVCESEVSALSVSLKGVTEAKGFRRVKPTLAILHLHFGSY